MDDSGRTIGRTPSSIPWVVESTDRPDPLLQAEHDRRQDPWVFRARKTVNSVLSSNSIHADWTNLPLSNQRVDRSTDPQVNVAIFIDNRRLSLSLKLLVMNALKSRCNELGLKPCSGRGITIGVLLAKINAEEDRLGVPKTVLTPRTAKRATAAKKKTTTASVASTTPPVALSTKENQYEKEIKEENPELHKALKPFFDKGIVPSCHLFNDQDNADDGGGAIAPRWGAEEQALMHDPWHALHAQLALLGMEGEEREKDRQRVAHYTGEKVKWKEWKYKDRNDLKRFVNHYDLLLWGIWRANKKRTTMLTLFTQAQRLDLYMPIKKVTRQMVEGILDIETGRQLYEIDPLFDIEKIDDGMNRIGVTYWKILSGKMTERMVNGYIHDEAIGNEFVDAQIGAMLDTGILKPSPELLFLSLASGTLFERFISDPKAALDKNDLTILHDLFRNHYWGYHIRELVEKIPNIHQLVEERLGRLIKDFSLNLDVLDDKLIKGLWERNLIPVFMAYKAIREKVSRWMLSGNVGRMGETLYTIQRIFDAESRYDKELPVEGWHSILLNGIGHTYYLKEYKIISSHYPLSYEQIVTEVLADPHPYYTPSAFSVALSFMPDELYNNRLIDFFIGKYSGSKYPYYLKYYLATIKTLINKGIYANDVKSIKELIGKLPTAIALLLLSKAPVKKTLGAKELEKLTKQTEARKETVEKKK